MVAQSFVISFWYNNVPVPYWPVEKYNGSGKFNSYAHERNRDIAQQPGICKLTLNTIFPRSQEGGSQLFYIKKSQAVPLGTYHRRARLMKQQSSITDYRLQTKKTNFHFPFCFVAYVYIYINKCCRFKQITEPQVIFLKPFTICSSGKRRFVVCLLTRKQTVTDYTDIPFYGT